MIRVILIGMSLLVCGSVYAETDHNIRVNRIEMTGTAPDESADTKATDHNSSRSNKTSSVASEKGDSDESEDDADGTRATDYNSSRSNKADGVALDVDDDTDDEFDEADEAEAADRKR